VTWITRPVNGVHHACVYGHGGNRPSDKQEQDMTDANNEGCELTVEDLEAVSGGRIKIEKPAAVLAWEIAKLEADNPGFC
jgi:hypothetical protein